MHHPHADQFRVLTGTAGPAGTPLQGCGHPPASPRLCSRGSSCPALPVSLAGCGVDAAGAKKKTEKPH